VRVIVRRFGVFFELCLDMLDIGLYPLTDEREVYEGREYPSDQTDHDRRSNERTESTSDSRDEIGPEHLPRRPDILHEFIKSG
jgi:hypothetical protein